MNEGGAGQAVIVRAASAADLGRMRAIYNYWVANSTASFAEKEESEGERRQWWDEHCQLGLPVLVAEKCGRVVGWASISRYQSRCAYRRTVEASVYLDKDETGLGIGGVLMRRLLVQARDSGFHCVVLFISAENDASIKLAANLGFEIVGTLKEVGRKFDRWLDVAIAQKILD